MLNTKIYATIGPASYQTATLNAAIKNGMNGIRINLSHGSLPAYRRWISNIKEVERSTNKKIPIIADIQGPEIRTGKLKENTVGLHTGESITITPVNVIENYTGNDKNIFINWPQNASQLSLETILRPGQIILIDDGLIKLEVKSIKKTGLYCKVLRGGLLGEKKGVNIPETRLPFSSLTTKDKKDIKTGIKLGIDFIMLPFTKSIDDVRILKDYLHANNGENIGIFAKIENQEGINNLDSFIGDIEGVVIARGDLGVEIGITRVPIAQKEIIKQCNQNNKESIVVTHMLHSMIESPLPTRAEISDIANAVLDGCNGVMLTGETAIGKYPVESVKVMYDTIDEIERWKQN